MPLTLNMFVSNVAATAGRPLAAQQNLQLNLTPKSDNVDDDNTAVFANPENKGASLNINGIKPELLAEFAGAPRVQVTITVLEK